jgi:hypothetical protein
LAIYVTKNIYEHKYNRQKVHLTNLCCRNCRLTTEAAVLIGKGIAANETTALKVLKVSFLCLVTILSLRLYLNTYSVAHYSKKFNINN